MGRRRGFPFCHTRSLRLWTIFIACRFFIIVGAFQQGTRSDDQVRCVRRIWRHPHAPILEGAVLDSHVGFSTAPGQDWLIPPIDPTKLPALPVVEPTQLERVQGTDSGSYPRSSIILGITGMAGTVTPFPSFFTLSVWTPNPLARSSEIGVF